MLAFEAAAVVVCSVAAACGGLRFARIAQREHYFAASLPRFAYRWWTATPLSLVLGALAIAGIVGVPFWRWSVFVTPFAVLVGPVGLGLRGRTSRLHWTRRCRLFVGTSVLVFVVVVVVVALLANTTATLTCAAGLCGFTPVVEALALVLVSPIEERAAARHVATARRRLVGVGPRVVAITGSYGKTSTKVYLAHLLAGRFSVLASPKSYNNRAGLSRTVNEHLVTGTDVVVAEMGTYGPGEIAALCAWLEPEIAVMTAIGPVHLERFKSLDRTLSSKAEITDGARTVVLNVDDERLASLTAGLLARGKVVLRCSAGGSGRDGADVLVERDSIHAGVTIELRGERFLLMSLPEAVPAGTLSNLACALGAALALGCTPVELSERVPDLPGIENRLRAARSETGLFILDDTFNSNPAGAAVALEELARIGAPGARRVLVTPGMVELGPIQHQENAAFARAAVAVASDIVIVGRTNRTALLEGATLDEDPVARPAIHQVRTRDEAVAWVREALHDGDVVLYENDLPDHYP